MQRFLKIFFIIIISVFIFYKLFFIYLQASAESIFQVSTADTTYDVIIVPGIPFSGGKWDQIMKGRVYWSYYLYSKVIARNIIYSGGAIHTPYIEAEIMAMYGEAIGIKKENIFKEPKAEHSTENVYYSYQLAKKLNFKSIALASDQFQTRMLDSFIKKYNLKIKSLPLIVDSLFTIKMLNPEIDYNKAYIPDFVPLKKRESLFRRITGSMGKNIKIEKEEP